MYPCRFRGIRAKQIKAPMNLPAENSIKCRKTPMTPGRLHPDSIPTPSEPMEPLRLPNDYAILFPSSLPRTVVIYSLCSLYGRSCRSASCNGSRDVETDQTRGDDEHNAEYNDYTSFVTSPVASLGELVTGIADLEDGRCRHLEDCGSRILACILKDSSAIG